MKSPEAEDKIDLLFYRPLGFLLAKLGKALGISPTHLTLAGMLTGILAGALFSETGSLPAWAAASMLFLVSGIFDSADGQLARIAGKSSPLGLVLDGLCDNIVFIAVYLGCCSTLLPTYGLWIWPVAVLAGVCHSCQSATLDFYNREFLYYTSAFNAETYWNPILQEANQEFASNHSFREKAAWRLRYSWLLQQEWISTRSPEVRRNLRELAHSGLRPDFRRVYRKHNRWLLHFWRPLGANIHTLAIISFALLSRFELYLILVDIFFLNAWLCLAWVLQKRSDQHMLAELDIAESPSYSPSNFHSSCSDSKSHFSR